MGRRRPQGNAQLARAMWPYLAAHRGKLLGALLLMIACTGLFQAGPLLIRHAVDADLPRHSIPGLDLTVALFVAAQALYVYFSYLQRMLLERTGQGVTTLLKQQLFDRVLTLSLSYFDQTPVGKLMARIESDTEELRQVFTFTAVVLVGDSVKLFMSTVIMLTIHVGMAMVVMGTLVVMVLITMVSERLGRPIFRASRERNAEVIAFLEEHLPALAVVQAFGQEERIRREMDAHNRAKNRADARTYVLWNGTFNVIMFMETVGLCAALAYGGSLVLRGAMSLGTVLMFTEFLRRFFEPVFRLSEQVGILQRAFASGERVFDLMGEAPHVADPPHPVPWNGLERGLEFRDVTFAYRDGEPVLRNVSFSIPRGERWAIVGPTGGGKSTIISLLLRFYDPQQGSVRVDGIDLRDLRQEALRSRCALVLQDVVIFPGSVRENLALGADEVPVERLEEAARLAAAHDFVEHLPQGYETELAERGSNLSTGQRQLLSFARALARDPEILILDEATGCVDPETERAVQDALHRLLEGRTALIVAHRLSTIESADRILVVEQGRIVEQGTHLELLAKEGAYRRLHRLQARAAREEARV